MKIVSSVLCLLLSALWLPAQQIRMKKIPRTNILHLGDLYLVDSWLGGANFTTRSANHSNLVDLLATNATLLSAFGAAGATNTFNTNQFSLSSGNVTIKDGARLTNITDAGWLKVMGNQTNDGNLDVTGALYVLGGSTLDGIISIPGTLSLENLASNSLVVLNSGKDMTNLTLGSGIGLDAATLALNVAQTPGVLNVASASTIVIDLDLTNTPLFTLTNPAAHNISLVVSNPAPGRWFTFYAEGSGAATNNALTWSSVAGVLLKWFDASTNTTVVSNGFVQISGYLPMTTPKTNLVLTYRDE